MRVFLLVISRSSGPDFYLEATSKSNGGAVFQAIAIACVPVNAS